MKVGQVQFYRWCSRWKRNQPLQTPAICLVISLKHRTYRNEREFAGWSGCAARSVPASQHCMCFKWMPSALPAQVTRRIVCVSMSLVREQLLFEYRVGGVLGGQGRFSVDLCLQLLHLIQFLCRFLSVAAQLLTNVARLGGLLHRALFCLLERFR